MEHGRNSWYNSPALIRGEPEHLGQEKAIEGEQTLRILQADRNKFDMKNCDQIKPFYFAQFPIEPDNVQF